MTEYHEPPDDYVAPSCVACSGCIIFVPVVGGHRWVHVEVVGHEADPGRWWDTATGTWKTGAAA